MDDDLQSLPLRSVRAYLKAHNRDHSIIDPPGSGMSGTVFFVGDNAIKVYVKAEAFERELAAYRRLEENGVRVVCGHRVPKLQGYNRSLLIIEMSTVKPPYLLDFASASLDDDAPDFSELTMAQWRCQMREEHGSNWTEVLRIDYALKKIGIHHGDLSPRNCCFETAGDEIDVDEEDVDDGDF